MSRVLAASATQCCYLVLSDGGLAWFPGLMLDKATLQTVVGDPAFRLFFGPNFAWLFERTSTTKSLLSSISASASSPAAFVQIRR